HGEDNYEEKQNLPIKNRVQVTTTLNKRGL
ncbi:hypothetical protein RRG08_006902, partial [Elysia crispata]